MSQQPNISCSQCGEEFGLGDRGFSHCDNHAELVPDTILEDITTAVIATTETKIMMNRVKMDKWGFPTNYNMECGDDGFMRVKDGRTLDEYLNNPEIVEARKKSKHSNQEWILVTADMYESSLMAGIA